MKIKKTYAAFTFAALLGAGGFGLYNQASMEMTTYTVPQGGHFSFPRVFRLKNSPTEIRWKVKFNNDADYHIRKEDGTTHNDQKDWNKLCGLFFSLLNTRKDSAMMGWRYNPEADEIELAPYYHVDGSRDMFPTMMTVRREELFTLTLRMDYEKKNYHWKMEKEGFESEHEMPFTHSGGLCGFINFYFGGNQPAPQTVSVDMFF